MEIWDRVIQCQCALFGIRGEKGIGKSRLLSRFLKKTGVKPDSVRMIFCRPENQNAPFFPILEEIRRSFPVETTLERSTLDEMFDLFGIRSSNRNRMAKILAQLLEVQLEPQGEKNILPPEILHQEALDLLTAFLLQRTPKSPLIVGIEDLHWADPLTLKVLKRIGVAPPPAPFLMLFTSRDFPERPGVDFPSVEHVFLEPFSSLEIADFLQKMDPDGCLSSECRTKIGKESDGIPLFVEELVHHYRKSPPLDPIHPCSIPGVLDDYLTHRLQTAGSNRFLLGKAAVIGDTFTRDMLILLCSDDERKNLDSRLEALIRSGLIKPSGGDEDQHFIFSNTLLRYKAYTSQTDRTRRNLHRRLCQLFENQTEKTRLFSIKGPTTAPGAVTQTSPAI
jgi:predicted ATPase